MSAGQPARAVRAGAAGRGALERFIGRALEQAVEGREAAGRGTLGPAPVDLLKAQDIGVEAEELGAQHGEARLDRGPVVGAVVEVLEVEGGEPQAVAHGGCGLSRS